MAVLAMLYGVLSQHSIERRSICSRRLFDAGGPDGSDSRCVSSAGLPDRRFQLRLRPCCRDACGVMLPMLPRQPVLLGGIIAPILWAGLIHSILGIVNPVLNQRIDWLWFVFSQVGFGVVAGIVVSRQERIRTEQRLPLALRWGLEASGMKDEDGRKAKNTSPADHRTTLSAASILAVCMLAIAALRLILLGWRTRPSIHNGSLRPRLWISIFFTPGIARDAMGQMARAAPQ